MRYANARFTAFQRDMAYRFFISDCARILTENTAKTAGNNSPYLTKRFIDVISGEQFPEPKEGEAKRSILSKLGE